MGNGNRQLKPARNSLAAVLGLGALFGMGQAYAASNVLVIDEGVDFSHTGFKGSLNENSAECKGKARKDDDKNGFTDDCLGWNAISNDSGYMPKKVKAFFDENTAKIKEIFAVFERAMGGDEEAVAYLRSHRKEYYLGESLLGLSHGTHVGGIIKTVGENESRLQSMNVFVGSDADVEGSNEPNLARPTAMPASMVSAVAFAKQITATATQPAAKPSAGSLFDDTAKIDALIEELRGKKGEDPKVMSEYVRASGSNVANLSLGASQIMIEQAVEQAWQQELGERGMPESTKRTKKQQANFNRLVNGIFELQAERWRIVFRDNPDVLFVIAAGNDGTEKMADAGNNEVHPVYPANASAEFDNVITVAATDDRGAIMDFSNYGPKYVNIGAPGSKINSFAPANMMVKMSGTSMAAPYVAGVAAQVRSANPALKAAEVRKILETTARQVKSLEGKTSTGGMVNLEAALQAAGSNKKPPRRGGRGRGGNDRLDLTDSIIIGGLDLIQDDVTNAGEIVKSSPVERAIARSLFR